MSYSVKTQPTFDYQRLGSGKHAYRIIGCEYAIYHNDKLLRVGFIPIEDPRYLIIHEDPKTFLALEVLL